MNRDDLFWNIEEHFHENDHKLYRKERKLAEKKDRSKFKKTDLDQRKKREDLLIPDSKNLNFGRVLVITKEGILVESDKIFFRCSLKGSLKQESKQIKNLVAVGDLVYFEKHGVEEGCICHIEKRYSILSRADNLSRKKEQLIAVNIDQVLITTSVLFPPLKPFLIDRYIIATKKGHMEPIIVINKLDLLKTPPLNIDPKIFEEEKALFEEFISIYSQLNFTVIPVSIENQESMLELEKIMKGKASVFSGQSGVGKSSLINAITKKNLEVGKIVEKTLKGSHTTTSSHLIPLKEGGFCIDTPGIKSFGLWNLELGEIQSYFQEIQSLAPSCKFQDCMHLKEPGCAVKTALEEGKISRLRFASYSALIKSLSQEHRHR